MSVAERVASERAEILGEIISETTMDSLEKELNQTYEVVVDKESDEHEYLLSARKLIWAPDIDGEIYINDKEIEAEIEFGKIYTVKITELAGDKLLGTIVQ